MKLDYALRTALLAVVFGVSFAPVSALEVKMTPTLEKVDVVLGDEVVSIQRIQDQSHKIEGGFSKTSRKCPPFCIQPGTVAPGVKTVVELDVFEFMQKDLFDGSGMIIDARTPAWFKKGTIPGSVNIPFTVFALDEDDPKLISVMEELGVNRRGEVGGLTRRLEKLNLLSGGLKNDHWDFTNAKTLLLWCNGPWCGQSPHAIHALLKLGYPAEKLLWYRGGMQMWQVFGLTTIIPEA